MADGPVGASGPARRLSHPGHRVDVVEERRPRLPDPRPFLAPQPGAAGVVLPLHMRDASLKPIRFSSLAIAVALALSEIPWAREWEAFASESSLRDSVTEAPTWAAGLLAEGPLSL